MSRPGFRRSPFRNPPQNTKYIHKGEGDHAQHILKAINPPNHPQSLKSMDLRSKETSLNLSMEFSHSQAPNHKETTV
ncbi:hypothetical protein Taro_020845 [Colocasia esculenta]|uniref:Uncharacterized protein n=1 Tax=Colocasia esculenta TaxID=4460 RepID=A0A843UXE0_COLES|nr:hypothetical protein [Colocasia esculenta]